MQIPEQAIWEQKNLPFAQLSSTGAKIADELRKKDFFCLWLVGNIGAGKTSITGHILRSLGLAPETPVTSPTFTYLSDYQLGEKSYAHLDFYRLDSNDHPISDLLSYLDYDGLFVEWPQNLGSHSESIHPTHVLRIEKGSDPDCRNYFLSEV